MTKVKREDGTWGLKQLESYGTTDPRVTKEEPMETNRLTEQLPQTNLETKEDGYTIPSDDLVSKTPNIEAERNIIELIGRPKVTNESPQQVGSIWDKTIKRLKKHYGDQNNNEKGGVK